MLEGNRTRPHATTSDLQYIQRVSLRLTSRNSSIGRFSASLREVEPQLGPIYHRTASRSIDGHRPQANWLTFSGRYIDVRNIIEFKGYRDCLTEKDATRAYSVRYTREVLTGIDQGELLDIGTVAQLPRTFQPGGFQSPA
jgi:hypothetical protein